MAKEFKLEITFNPETKDCKVTGPVNEPALCELGMELARRVIKQYNSKRIVFAHNVNPTPLKVPLPDLRKLSKEGV